METAPLLSRGTGVTNSNKWDLTAIEMLSNFPTSLSVNGVPGKNEAKTGGLMWLPMSIFNLITTVVGAGLLSLPYGFSIGGVIPTAVALVFTTIVSLFSGVLLVDSVSYLPPTIHVFNYEDIAQFAFGKIGRVLVLLTIIVLLLPSHMAYMILTRDQLDLVIQFGLAQSNISLTESNVGFYLTQPYIVQTLAFLPILPIIFLPSLRYLAYSSLFGFVCIIFVSFSFVYLSIYNFAENAHSVSIEMFCTSLINISTNSTDSKTFTCIPLWPNSIFEFLHAITLTALVFVCHFNILPLKSELYKPTSSRVKSSIFVTILTAFALYTVTIIFTLLQFGTTLKSDVMENYDQDNILFVIGRIALFLSLLLSYPLLLFPCRAAIISLFIPVLSSTYRLRRLLLTQKYSQQSNNYKPEVNVNILVWFILTIIIFLIAFIPTCFIVDVGVVWGFVGAIGSSLVVFVWPSLFYIQIKRLYWKRMDEKFCFLGVKGVLSIILLVAGSFIMIVCTINQILMIILPNLF